MQVIPVSVNNKKISYDCSTNCKKPYLPVSKQVVFSADYEPLGARIVSKIIGAVTEGAKSLERANNFEATGKIEPLETKITPPEPPREIDTTWEDTKQSISVIADAFPM